MLPCKLLLEEQCSIFTFLVQNNSKNTSGRCNRNKFVLFCSENFFFFQNYLCQGHLSIQCAEGATKRFSEKKMCHKFQETIANYLKFR